MAGGGTSLKLAKAGAYGVERYGVLCVCRQLSLFLAGTVEKGEAEVQQH